MTDRKSQLTGLHSRRAILKGSLAASAGIGALGVGGVMPFHLVTGALADDMPALGTWPAGSSGSSVTIGGVRPAHRRVCRPGRRRTEGHGARGRAHQPGPRPYQADRTQGHERRSGQGSEAGFRRWVPSPTMRCNCRTSSLPTTRSSRTPWLRRRGCRRFEENAQSASTSSISSPLGRTIPRGKTARATASASACTARPAPTRSVRSS